MGLLCRFVCRKVGHAGALEEARSLEDVFGQVDKDRARTSRGCNGEGFFNGAGQVFNSVNKIVVLCAGSSDADYVSFLKRVVTYQGCRYLAGEDHYWDGIHVRRGKSCNRIGPSGAGCHYAYTGLACGSGVSVGRVDCGLFVTDEYESEVMGEVSYQCVENVNDHPAGISEDCGYSFFFEGLKKDLGTVYFHFLSCCWMERLFRRSMFVILAGGVWQECARVGLCLSTSFSEGFCVQSLQSARGKPSY